MASKGGKKEKRTRENRSGINPETLDGGGGNHSMPGAITRDQVNHSMQSALSLVSNTIAKHLQALRWNPALQGSPYAPGNHPRSSV